MRYVLVRLIALVVLCIIALLCLRYVRWFRQKEFGLKGFIFAGFVAAVCFVLIFPYENLFFHFETPEEAFQYSHFGARVRTVSEEESCAFIVYATNETNAKVDLIEKGSNGWNINPPGTEHKDGYKLWTTTDQEGKGFILSLKLVQSDQSNQLFVMVERQLNISQTGFKDIPSEVAVVYDNLGSSYKMYTETLAYWYMEYHYTVVNMEDVHADYQIYLDGEPIDPFVELGYALYE